MEGNKKLYGILIGTSVILLTAAYGVGYYVGNTSGYEKANKEFTVEKQRLLKTIASLTPLSRPKPEEKVVVVNNENETQNGTENNTTQVTKKEKEKVQTTQPEKATENKKEVKETETKKTVEKKKETKTVTKAKKNYYIQLGVFGKKSNAEKLAIKLAKADIPAHVKKIGKLYKVTAGLFTKTEAEKTLRKLKKMKIEGIIKRR